MKKLILALILALLSITTNTSPTLAQEDYGTYGCIWDNQVGCILSGNKTQCRNGGTTSEGCQSLRSASACNGTIISCLAPSTTRYKCSGSSCVACPSSESCPYNSPQCSNQCQSAVSPGDSSQNTEVTCSTGSGTGINTAIGCIPIENQNAFVGFLLRWAIGIGGGIAFVLILYAGFQIMTSQGDPQRLKAGQELLTSAIGGLIMLIFSVFILRVIGVDILQIRGLTP